MVGVATEAGVSRQLVYEHFADLETLGVSYDDVVKVLEDEGVSKFEVSWNEMLETIESKSGVTAG